MLLEFNHCHKVYRTSSKGCKDGRNTITLLHWEKIENY